MISKINAFETFNNWNYKKTDTKFWMSPQTSNENLSMPALPNKDTITINSKKKHLLPVAMLGAGLIGGAIALFCAARKPSALIETPLVQNISSYKSELLKSMCMKTSDVSKLDSIVEKSDFLKFLKEIQNSPKVFEVGENFEGVINKTFGANLHIHTTHSDGQMSVEKLLDQSVKYADKYFEKNKKPFYIAITDHDTTTGCKEALDIITKTPEKFKNLKVVLGSEITTSFENNFSKAPKKVDLLAYCVNPFDNNISQLNKNNLLFQQDSVKTVINNANFRFLNILTKNNVEYSYKDFAKIRPSINTTTGSLALSMKDYMQFRLIYANIVEQNPKLLNEMKKNGISLENLDFSEPKRMVMAGKMSKKPFWENYVEEVKNYIKNKAQETNPNADINELNKCFKNVSQDVITTLDELDRVVPDPASDLFVKTAKKLDFDDVVTAFSKDKDIIVGIPHPCITSSEEINNPNVYDLMEDLFSRFKKISTHNENLYEGYYQSYWDTVTDSQKSNVNKIAEKYGFLKSGGLDSHFDNIFTDQKGLNQEYISQIIEGVEK
ncbi:MAG: hypothetical protein PHV37_03390 [Candidatus Gastranaerophilales bacterium]|nr:hypothetical protein [Candidatus Gastranaerophilales bacterium]